MKKIFLFIWIVIAALPLASCGKDMRNWPYCTLDFNVTKVKKLYIEFVQKDDSIIYEKYITTDTVSIQEMKATIERLHYNPKTISKDVSEYHQKVAVYFIADDFIYDFKNYNFGLTNYFCFNDEIREFPADFMSVYSFYMKNYKDNFIALD